MNWKIIFNPFSRFSEKQLFIAGFIGFVIIVFLSSIFKIRMDSIYHMSSDENLTLSSALIFAGLSYISAIIVLSVLGKIFNKHTRVIDVVNTVMISQVPMVVLVLISNISIIKNIQKAMIHCVGNPKEMFSNFSEIIVFMVFTSVTLVVLVYSFALLYNGFKTATNMKSPQKISVFAIVVFFFVIICQTVLPTLNI